MEATHAGLGRCACAFWLAVVFDFVGLLVLLIGVFSGMFFFDFLIYAGSIIIFLSLIWWVFWYTGNIEVPPGEPEEDVGTAKKNRAGIANTVRRLSSRLSRSIRSSLWRKGGPDRSQGHGAHITADTQQRQQPADLNDNAHTVDCVLPSPHTTTETSPT
ncbi:transmembrane protein 238-like [Lampris incognitus]|uniref:transmembrane protein 238-like n=1 Tax=Lampris incognitus TaxID=2546036 RepID=UPI0024B5B522|nr:transmembrane protein 238-like [Lampris incognitus]